MAVLTVRRVLYVAGNLLAAVAVPALFNCWLRGQTPAETLEPGEDGVITTAIRAFAAAWIIFLVAFNVTGALFFWFRRSG